MKNTNIASIQKQELNQKSSVINFPKNDIHRTDTRSKIQMSNKVLELNSYSFDNLISECISGEECHFTEDPWKLYKAFKKNGQSTDLYNIIFFLKMELSKIKNREPYKEIVKKMIIEEYSKDEDFDIQMAEYYFYLGEEDNSLSHYLKAEKLAFINPKLYMPLTNIAEIYYSKKQYKKALPYYKKALSNLTTGKEDEGEFQRDSIDFLERRITQCASN